MKNQLNIPSRNFVYLFFISFYLIIVIRTAWIGDDAFITFRTIDNYVYGFGLRWNIAERVQVYTHPLWMFCISAIYYITDNIYFSALFWSILVSLITIFLLSFCISNNKENTIICLLILIFSRAFIDYSTSGLENPLTHLLLIIYFIIYFQFENKNNVKHLNHKIFLLSLIASMGVFNRFDVILIYIPSLLYIIFRNKLSVSKFFSVFLGFIPFILWELFSLFYYGFLFPNTAYAKLNTNIPDSLLIEQGFYYLLNSLSCDPITLFVIFSLIIYIFIFNSKNKFDFFIAIGSLLYIVYVVKIGGCFMSGRFFSAPLLSSVVLFKRIKFNRLRSEIAILIGVILLGLNSPFPTIKSNETHTLKKSTSPLLDFRGITDERGWYFQDTGLLMARRERTFSTDLGEDSIDVKAVRKRSRIGGTFSANQEGNSVEINRKTTVLVKKGGIGRTGFYTGPNLHLIDNLALTDPLLARLPCLDTRDWRIGHIDRMIPSGYKEFLSGSGSLSDESLNQYIQKLNIVIRGDLFSWHRIKEIWNFNIGKYNQLINEYCFRECYHYDYSELSEARKPASRWDFNDYIMLNRYGIGINISSKHILRDWFSVSLSGGYLYKMIYYREGNPIAEQNIDLKHKSIKKLAIYEGIFNQDILHEGFDMIRIIPPEKSANTNLHSR